MENNIQQSTQALTHGWYEQLFNNVHIGVLIVDEDRMILEANQTFCNLFGYATPAEVLGQSVIMLHVSDDSSKRFGELVFTQVLQNEPLSTRYQFKRKDGSTFWAMIAGQPDQKGTGVLWTIVDINEQVIAEEALQQSELKFRILADHTADWESWTNLQDQYVYISPSCERITGYTPEEFISNRQLLFELVSVTDKETLLQHYKETNDGLIPPHVMEFPITTKTGQERWIEHYCCAVFDEQGNYAGRRSNNRDITQRKQVEADHLELEEQLRQKKKMEAVGYMAGGMAHNFNNNLGIILGNVELSQLKVQDPKVQGFLKNAKTAILRSRDLVKQIITYSRGGIQNKAPMKLVTIVDETITLLGSTLPATINLQKTVSSACNSAFIHADASQMQEILVNLCNNAVQAMDEKGELIISLEPVELSPKEISVEYDALPGRYAKMSVQDTGCGMPAEMLDKIFDPFFTTKEDYEGAGMGLATVQGIVAQHGGVIKVNSIPDQGTVFNFYFPMVDGIVTELETEDSSLPRGTERILFVDDDEMLASLGERLLTQHGYQVTKMFESSEALKLFAANADRFHLVITDQTMPDLTGEELIQEVKKISPDMPTILCTGYSSKVDEDKAEELGINAFLMKPLDLPKLLQTVRRVLDGDKE